MRQTHYEKIKSIRKIKKIKRIKKIKKNQKPQKDLILAFSPLVKSHSLRMRSTTKIPLHDLKKLSYPSSALYIYCQVSIDAISVLLPKVVCCCRLTVSILIKFSCTYVGKAGLSVNIKGNTIFGISTSATIILI